MVFFLPGGLLQKFLLAIDRFSTRVGQLRLADRRADALRVVGVFHVTYGQPARRAFDAMTMMYGTMFMMAGAYTLSKNGHVRATCCMGSSSPARRQRSI